MLTITRRLAATLHRVIRGTRGRQPRPGPAVGFIGGKEGLIAKADCGDVFVEYRIPGSFAAESLWLPFEFLGDCEGKTDDVVELETKATHRVTAKWHDRSGPQNISYNVPSPPVRRQFSNNAQRFRRQSTPLPTRPDRCVGHRRS